MVRRLLLRTAGLALFAVLAIGVAPATALGHWTDIPFPADGYSGWVDTVDGWAFPYGVDKVVEDSAGNLWAITNDFDGVACGVYFLGQGASRWEDVTGEIWTGFGGGGPRAIGDIEVVGEEVFVAASSGVYRRTASDDAWRRTDAGGNLWMRDMEVFDGAPWLIDVGALMRFDAASDSWVEVMDGIPPHGDGTDWANFSAAANDDYLYAGLYSSNDSDPSYPVFDVYRITRGGTRWEPTGLELARPPDWDEGVGVVGGVGQVYAIDGYAFAGAYDGDGYSDFVFDESTETWERMPPPGWSDGGLIAVGAAQEWDGDWGDGRLHHPASVDSAAGTVHMLTWDPSAGRWAESRESAFAWAPLRYGAVGRNGGDLVVPVSAPDAGFVSSVPLPTEVSRDPEVIGTNAALALFFAATFGFTSAMFNNTLKDNFAEISRMTEPVAKLLRRLRASCIAVAGPLLAKLPGRDSPSGRWRRLADPLAIVTGTALIYCFLDPGFGLSASGLALFLSMAVAVAAVTLSYDGLQSRIANSRYGSPAALKVQPAALLIALLCVLVSRLMAFHPGYVYGMVGGLAFVGAVEPERGRMGRLVLLTSLALLGISLAAWLLLIPVAPWSGSDPAFFPGLIQGTLAAVFVMGLEGLLFGLMPMRFMDGEKVWDWSRWAWLGLFGAVAFAFWHVLLNRNSRYLDSLSNKNVRLMLGLLVAYSVVTVATWLWFRRRRARLERGAEMPAAASVPMRAPAPAPQPVPAPQSAPAPTAPEPRSMPEVIVPATAETKTCPRCAEEIRAEAVLCRFCRAMLRVERRGYCSPCRAVVQAAEQDLCPACGASLVDPHLVTTVVGQDRK